MEYKMLEVLDEMIEGYVLQHGSYPIFIIANEDSKEKILTEWKDCLASQKGVEISRKANCYRGIPITVSNEEPFIKMK